MVRNILYLTSLLILKLNNIEFIKRRTEKEGPRNAVLREQHQKRQSHRRYTQKGQLVSIPIS